MNYDIKKEIEVILQEHIEDENRKFSELKEDMRLLRVDMKAFTDAWQQARGVITFVKWMVSIAGGLTAFLLFLKDHWK